MTAELEGVEKLSDQVWYTSKQSTSMWTWQETRTALLHGEATTKVGKTGVHCARDSYQPREIYEHTNILLGNA